MTGRGTFLSRHALAKNTKKNNMIFKGNPETFPSASYSQNRNTPVKTSFSHFPTSCRVRSPTNWCRILQNPHTRGPSLRSHLLDHRYNSADLFSASNTSWRQGSPKQAHLSASEKHSHVLSLMPTPGPSRFEVWTKTVAVYRASGESPSKQYWGRPAGMVISCCPLLEAAGGGRGGL